MPKSGSRPPAKSARKSAGSPVAEPPKGKGGSRDAAIQFLTRKLGGQIFEGIAPLQGVSTGCVAVDYITGINGFPRGRVSEVFGLESSGKSTLCMTACAKAQQMGLYAVYVDVERSLDNKYAAKLGFDTSQPGVHLTPTTFEETLVIIDTMAQKAGADIILVDSVPAMVPKVVFDSEITEMGQFGQAARLFAGALPRLTKTIEQTNTALVFVNQLRANIASSAYASRFEPKEKSFGGYALRYYSSLRIGLKQTSQKARLREVPHPTEQGKTVEIPVASAHRATVIKSKVAAPYQALDFMIRFDKEIDVWGIDNLQTRIDIARRHDVIQMKHGGIAMFDTSTGDRITLRGEQALYDWFQQRPEEVASIVKRSEAARVATEVYVPDGASAEDYDEEQDV